MGNACGCCQSKEARQIPSRSAPSAGAEGPRLVAMFNYSGLSDAEVSFSRGDLFDIELEKCDAGTDWKFVSKVSGGLGTGYAPAAYLTTVGSLEAEPWFFEELGLYEAKTLLTGTADGVFLVRKTGQAIILSLSFAGSVVNYDIEVTEDGCKYGVKGTEQRFESLQKLTEGLRENQNGIACRLTEAVEKRPPGSVILPVQYAKQWKNFARASITLGNKLGEGNFGVVFKAVLNVSKDKSIPAAVKQLKLDVAGSRKRFFKEAFVMKCCFHPNLVRLLGVVSGSKPFWILTEFVNSGDLKSYLQKRKADGSWLKEVELLDLCYQVAKAMQYLEQRDIVHFDLYARNVFVEEIVETSGESTLVAKVGDFGMARLVKKGTAIVRQVTVETLGKALTVPELFRRGKYSSSSDVWSFGILVYEIMSHGNDVVKGLTADQLKDRTLKESRVAWSAGMPDRIRGIVGRCLCKQSEKRPTFVGLVSTVGDLLQVSTSGARMGRQEN